MKLSKKLLKSIAVGISLGTVTACTNDIIESSHEITECSCTTDETCEAHKNGPFDCPACGMG